jgi:hypothetical protein
VLKNLDPLGKGRTHLDVDGSIRVLLFRLSVIMLSLFVKRWVVPFVFGHFPFLRPLLKTNLSSLVEIGGRVPKTSEKPRNSEVQAPTKIRKGKY